MRKQLTILSVLLFLLTSAVHGQVTQANTQFPNPGFEKWSDHGCSTAQGTSEVPDNWHTFDEVKYFTFVRSTNISYRLKADISFNFPT